MSQPFDFYDVSILPILRNLATTQSTLRKAQESTLAPTLPQSRLIDDMYPLTTQIHIIADNAATVVSKITGDKPIEWVREDIKTFEHMQDALATATQEVEKLDRETVNSAVGKMVGVAWSEDKPMEIKMTDYIALMLPNMNFHVVTVYNICRKEGVELGKRDYMGAYVKHLL